MTSLGHFACIPVLMIITNCPIFIFEKDYKLSNQIVKTLSNQYLWVVNVAVKIKQFLYFARACTQLPHYSYTI